MVAAEELIITIVIIKLVLETPTIILWMGNLLSTLLVEVLSRSRQFLRELLVDRPLRREGTKEEKGAICRSVPMGLRATS